MLAGKGDTFGFVGFFLLGGLQLGSSLWLKGSSFVLYLEKKCFIDIILPATPQWFSGSGCKLAIRLHIDCSSTTTS